MGLDMYVKAFSKEDGEPTRDTDFKADWNDIEIFYWRKHPDLHGWFKSLYYEKGGGNRWFNGNVVRIYKEDLDRLEADIINNTLPNTSGFFFGLSAKDDNQIAEDLSFIRKAKEYLDTYVVYYNSSW